MAYGALLQGEGHNIAGDFYRVTIYEDGFGGSLITGTLAVPLFNLTYQPVVDDISSSLCPSVLDPEQHSNRGYCFGYNNLPAKQSIFSISRAQFW